MVGFEILGAVSSLDNYQRYPLIVRHEDTSLNKNFLQRRLNCAALVQSSLSRKKSRSLMEKLVRSCDKEYMRMAMLKHEETFKEQVYELHRLYRIQKILMQNVEARRVVEVSEEEWYFKNAISLTHKGAQEKPQMKFDLERPADEHIAESEDGVLEVIDETEIELTLGPSSYNRRKKVETPLTSDSGQSLSSSSSGSSHINKTRCHGSQTRREESGGSIIRLVPGSTPGCQSGIRNSFDIEEQLRQERLKQSPWLFQVLNLNMT
ncbi:unnamed protein product [Sphenostylis stenocarpa]|uniref:Uncharacterized protein n=1 Tax=Sphenostylis stenocarpa TaxID=92480 RepID=A0AA86SL69_9FABA|nr:unnamed protein product [Sphenostylis stenocarpa]